MRSNNIRWVSPVGNDPATGGGVAKAVHLFGKHSVLPNSEFVSLAGMGKWSQCVLALKDILIHRYQKFVIHSFFSPYALCILALPLRCDVVVLPHGELKSGALKISARVKQKCLSAIQMLSRIWPSSKRVIVMASNHEECELAKHTMQVTEAVTLSDIVSQDAPIPNVFTEDIEQGINLVIIARLVPNKGVSEFLNALLNQRVSGQLTVVNGVHLFVQAEEPRETAQVKSVLEQLTQYGITTRLYEGKDSQGIAQITQHIPNKLAVLSSQFESFSYVLIETLYFEYPPVVWFDNELVSKLTDKGLCVRWAYGYCPSDEDLALLKYQNDDAAKAFVEQLSHQTQSQYVNFFKEVF